MPLLHIASSFFLSAQAAHGSILLILKAEDVLPLMLTLKGRETVDLTYPQCGALFNINAHSGTFTVPHFNDLQVPFPSIFISLFHTFQHALWSDNLINHCA